jgi:hypothetical protein
MSTPVEPSPFGTPGVLPPVTFSSGGHQTFRGQCPDGLYPATVKKVEACVSTFEGKQTAQYVFMFQIDGREGDGELAWYTSQKYSTHQKAKLRPTLIALGLPQPTPENPNLPNPIGAKARILVQNEAKRDGSGMFPKVKQILPIA